MIFMPLWSAQHRQMMPRTINNIKNEPMLFQASVNFAFDNGGPITREFIYNLPPGEWSIDSRVHMLKPGWFPAIPGWHLDAIPRSKITKQPDFSADTSRIEGFFTTVSDVVGLCETEFLSSPVDLEIIDRAKFSLLIL